MGKTSGGVLRAAGVMGAATFVSRILGLVREQVFAFLFGAGNATDAFQVAFRIPNLLRDLFAEGAMSASLVPTFTQVREKEGNRGAWRLAGLVFRVLTAAVGIIALIGIIFAPQLVDLYASAFRAETGKYDLTVQMTRVMFPFFPLVALAAAFMGVLNSCGVFFLPALASALFNLASVISGVFFVYLFRAVCPQWGIDPIIGMALGVLIGGGVQAFCQLPALYRVGYRWPKYEKLDPPWYRDAGLQKMLTLMIPGMLGLAATQISILVNTILATSQGPGAVSWLNYAFRFMQFPIGIFGVSLASATLPRISKLWVEQDVAGVSETLAKSLRYVFAINLPASAGLIFLGVPIIQLVFQYGRFQASDSQATALALSMYTIGLTAYSAVKVLVPSCYALGNTRIPVISSLLSIAASISLNLLMIRPFGYWGLALGTSVAAFLNVGFLLIAIRRILTEKGIKFPLIPLLCSFGRNAMVAVVMGGLCYVSHRGLNQMLNEAASIGLFGDFGVILARGLSILGVILEGAILAVILAHLFGVEETTEVVHLFFGKLKKKLRAGKT